MFKPFGVTVTLHSIRLDVDGSIEVVKDMYGTGDSPTGYEISIDAIRVIDSEINIYDLLEGFIDAIHELVMEEYKKGC